MGRRLIKTRSDCKVDTACALKMRAQGLSYAEIAKTQGTSKQAVHRRLQALLPDADTDAYKAMRADILSKMQLKVLETIDDESIQKAPLAARAMAFGVLYDKERLERGQSTSNMMSIHADLETLRGARRESQEADSIDV